MLLYYKCGSRTKRSGAPGPANAYLEDDEFAHAMGLPTYQNTHPLRSPRRTPSSTPSSSSSSSSSIGAFRWARRARRALSDACRTWRARGVTRRSHIARRVRLSVGEHGGGGG